MTATIIPFGRRSSDPVRVEITSPGTLHDERPYYFVDYIEADGGRSCMWDGTDFDEAHDAARDCAGAGMPVVDLVCEGAGR